MSEAHPREPLPPVPPAHPTRRRWPTLLLAAVIFLSGFIVGTGTTVLVVRNRLVAAIHHPEQAPDRIAGRLRRSLDLTDVQTAEITKILHLRQTALQDIRRRVQPEVMAQLDLVEQEIAAVLGPDQKEKWHGMARQLRATWLPAAPQRVSSSSP